MNTHKQLRFSGRLATSLLVIGLAANAPAFALDVYASLGGLPTNNGSIGSPVDLATMLAADLPPGTNVWLRGGT